jgi:hypothetical protein
MAAHIQRRGNCWPTTAPSSVADRFVPAPPTGGSDGRLRGVTAVSVCLLLLVGVPLGTLFSAAFEQGAAIAWSAVSGDGSGRLAQHAWTSFAVSALAVAGGTTAAFITEGSRAPGRRWMRGAMLAALFSAPLVSAVGWTRAYGRGGLLDEATGSELGRACSVRAASSWWACAARSRWPTPSLRRAWPAGWSRTRNEPHGHRERPGTGPAHGDAAVGASRRRRAAALVFVSAVNAFEVPAVLGIPAVSPR